MRKILTGSLLLLALSGGASAATATLNWTAPAASGVVSIQIWDLPPSVGVPLPNTQIGSAGPTATTFTTGTLTPGTHQFTAVAVYATGSAAPSNTASGTVAAVLAPVTNLTVTINP